MQGGTPVELKLLAASVVLLLVYITVQGAFVLGERGIPWSAGPRDDTRPPAGRLTGRAERALANYKETWPAFIALALGLAVAGRTGGAAATGAWLWLGARVVYLPLYLLGTPWLRSLAYGVSLAGLVMMLAALV